MGTMGEGEGETNCERNIDIDILLRLCSKSFKLAFRSKCTENFKMFKMDLKKAEEPEINMPTIVESLTKQGNSRKTSISASLAIRKPLHKK